MLDIQLDPYHKITSDSMNYVLAKRSKSKNKDGVYTWSGFKYHSTVEGLLKAYKELEIRDSDATTIPELLEVVQGIDKKIEKILNGV